MTNEKIFVKAEVTWIPESEGGRSIIPPIGSTYGTNLRFEGEETLWSIVIQPETAPDKERGQVVKLAFLFPENLTTGLNVRRKFLVFEGPQKLVAVGRILFQE